MTLFLVVTALTLGGTFFASRVPNEGDMVNTFREAQRFYAEGAYDQAIAQYEAVSKIRSRALHSERIQVAVGQGEFPLQEAADYQIGNSYAKVYEDHARGAEDERRGSRRAELETKADSAFAAAASAFQRVIAGSTSEVLKVQAYGRLIDLNFKARRYPEVIEAARALSATYPEDPRVVVGYYNTGWALYKMKDYDGAIDAFEALLARFPTGYRADRSLFQIGECYLETGRYDQAMDAYRQLIDRQQVQDLTEVELRRIQREKIAGLVDETALELAAKAQIRIGTCYARLGRYEEGLSAYRQVITLFGSERSLVEEAYLRMADLHQEMGDFDASIRTYREAIDQSAHRTLRARIQYALAESYFSRARYDDAVREYRVYLDGYGDIALAAGFTQGRVRYRIGSAYQQLADSAEGQDRPAVDDWLKRAIAQYDTLCSDETSPYFLDARFNRALAFQSLGTDSSLALAEEEFGAIVQEAVDQGYVQRALVQLSELHYERGQYDQAARTSQKLLDAWPDSDYEDKAYMRLALSHQAAGDPERALPAFLEVPESSPLFARARLGGGHGLLNAGRFSEAARVLAEGLSRVDDDVQRSSFNYLLGQAYGGLGENSRAVTHFSAALEYPVAPELAQALRFSRGNAAFSIEAYDLAEKDFAWIVDHVHHQEKIRSAKDALALIYVRQNRGTEAVRTLADMAAEATSPEERAHLLSRLMDLHYQENNHTETIALGRRLIDLDFADELSPGQAYRRKEKAYFLMGDALARLDRSAEAAEVFTTALQRFPESYFATDMRLALGVHYFEQGELKRAKGVFVDLVKADSRPDHRLMAGFYLANTQYSLREFDQAQTSFDQLLRDYPEAQALPDLLFGLAESHYQLGDFEAAIHHYQRILAEFPRDATAARSLYNTAWCLIELKRQDEAMEAFRTLLERYPRSEFASSAQFTLADDAYNRGFHEEAMRAYRLVQERFPGDPLAAQVPRLLSEITEAIAYKHYEQALALMNSARTAEEETRRKEYFEQAISSFQEISARYPGTESELGALSNMGVCLEELRQWREAVAVYDQVIEMYNEKRASKEVFQFVKAHKDWIVTTRL